MGIPTSACQPGPGEPGGVLRADLATGPAPARQARAAVRQALAAWGMDDPSGDAELLASELVANAPSTPAVSTSVWCCGGTPGGADSAALPARSPTTHLPCPGPARPSRVTNAAGAWRSSPPLPRPAVSGPRRAARRPGSPS